ncbi:hypothetical protein QAD02_012729 [Eretmocerus hayati]|uniref:Uncharacterized protein n=1 Tax=Eretmocerus hayati TaxID=131215 RepID=A0ACC2P0Q8_9HYME|nr:hypothetical protein QAD02_012729 [Eretmocerus hayati]
MSGDRNNVQKELLKHNNLKVPLKPKRSMKKHPKPTYDPEWDEEEYYDELDCDLQDEDSNALNFILNIGEEHKFREVFHKFSILPFIITYWHPDQVTLWNEYSRTESVLSLIVLNSVVPKITGLNESKNISLFALSAKIGISTILFTQMISDSSDPMDMEYFLTSWLQNGAPPPAQVTVGYSYNLLDATSLAFNSCSFDEYNLRCYKYLSSTLQELPSTRVQLDIITVIKVITQWQSLTELSQSIQDFYACSIMYLSTVQNISLFEEAVITVLTLCQSPYLSNQAEKMEDILWVQLQSDTIKEMMQQYLDFTTVPRSTECFSYYDPIRNQIIMRPDHELHDYIDHLKRKALNLCIFNREVGTTVNDYYSPIILESLMQLLSEFPSWTQIIPTSDKYSTLVSSNVMKHSVIFPRWKKLKTLEDFFEYHIKEVTAMNQVLLEMMAQEEKYEDFLGKNIIASGKIASKSVASDPSSTTVAEVAKPDKTVVAEPSPEIDLESLKVTFMATTHLMSDFDIYVNKFLEFVIAGQETEICQTLLECCIEMERYEQFFGILVEKFCFGSNSVAQSFAEMFEDVYKNLEIFEKNKLKNIMRLYAYLLSSDSISWEIFSQVKVNEEALTEAKEIFLKRLLFNLTELMDDRKLQEKLLSVYNSCEGLFPSTNEKNSRYAQNFYKSIGLKNLADLCRHEGKHEKYASISGTTHLPKKRKKCKSVMNQIRRFSSPAPDTPPLENPTESDSFRFAKYDNDTEFMVQSTQMTRKSSTAESLVEMNSSKPRLDIIDFAIVLEEHEIEIQTLSEDVSGVTGVQTNEQMNNMNTVDVLDGGLRDVKKPESRILPKKRRHAKNVDPELMNSLDDNEYKKLLNSLRAKKSREKKKGII